MDSEEFSSREAIDWRDSIPRDQLVQRRIERMESCTRVKHTTKNNTTIHDRRAWQTIVAIRPMGVGALPKVCVP